jgi:hypothetical protein
LSNTGALKGGAAEEEVSVEIEHGERIAISSIHVP